MCGRRIGPFAQQPFELTQRSLVLAGPQTALRNYMMQLRIVGIGDQGAFQLRNSLGVHACSVIAHPQQRSRLKVFGVDFQYLAERPQGCPKIPQLELSESQVQLDFPDVRFDGKRFTVAVGCFLVLLLPGKLEAHVRQRLDVPPVARSECLAALGACGRFLKAEGQQNVDRALENHGDPSPRGAGPVESRNTSSGSMTTSRPETLQFEADSGTSIPNARWPMRSRGICSVVSDG